MIFRVKVVIAVDSFKGSLSSMEAAKAIERGIVKEIDCDIVKLPLADGGEGTVDALVCAMNGRYIEASVLNPLGERIKAQYGAVGSDTAIIEMAAASGITLIKKDKLNPLIATTYGTGELIADALDKGFTNIVIGVGGSATNDGGAGMAMALGAKLLDAKGNEIPFGGVGLPDIDSIDVSGMHDGLKSANITVLCDVTNTICGESGASNVFGHQKGADDIMVKALDSALYNFSDKIKKSLSVDVLDLKGGGAAGGLAAGLVAFCGAQIKPGFEYISSMLGLEEKIKSVDLVITGEGRTDAQTAFGKLPSGVGKIAKRCNVPAILISGAVEGDISKLYENGISAAFSAVTSVMPLEYAMENAAQLLERAAVNVIRLFSAKI